MIFPTQGSVAMPPQQAATPGTATPPQVAALSDKSCRQTTLLQQRYTVFFGFALSFFFLSLSCPTFAQIPPLQNNNPLTPPTQRRVTPRKPDQPSARPKTSGQKSLLPTPHAAYVFGWGQKFQKHLPRGWRMDWDTTSLRNIQWQAGPQLGHQIRFTHEKKKVPVPVPFPNFQPGSNNTEVVPMRCTLHFFPLQGKYHAYDNRINRMTPATLIAVTKKALVFLPDRFLAKEFPCPEVLKKFHQFTRSSRKGRAAPRSWYRKLRQMGFRHVKIRRFRYHVSLSFRGSQRSVPWKALLRYFRKPTLVVRFEDTINQWVSIYNR